MHKLVASSEYMHELVAYIVFVLLLRFWLFDFAFVNSLPCLFNWHCLFWGPVVDNRFQNVPSNTIIRTEGVELIKRVQASELTSITCALNCHSEYKR
jgi:hypothetical protein